MSLGKPLLSVLVAGAALVALVGAPAAAETAGYRDPADASASLTDIRHVTVRHGGDGIAVVVRFTDLRRRSTGGPAGLSVFFDTVGRRRGPEFQLGTGLQAGTDYQLVRSRHRRGVGDPIDCDYSVRLRYDADRMVLHADRDCLGTPDRVRVGVLMTDEWDGSHPVEDWLGEPRSWTAWLTAG
ncbi:hypothetical protein [Nocardioides mangrovi]|uniref:Uncharacterized protein n=1 Tax=Nocardioides mangrovi TaxID=2874580 RepID=A0ABS7UJK9_9ACTN|nr:hypothetical protein [Nocardioides mangrovi]MBZ5741205.1 hypothetical protein [Nocardioides mangrovi]